MLRHDSTCPHAAGWLLAISALVTTAHSGAAGLPSKEQETFRTDVVLLTIDVQVTPAKEAALRQFGPEDFEVTVSGRRRPVTSAVRLHLDESSVVPNPPRPGRGSNIDCIFGFHRRTDRPTAHYLLGIQPDDAVRAAKAVSVRTADPAFATEWSAWRLPIR